jgi:hypothetical protein
MAEQFVLGEEASRSKLVGLLQGIRDKGVSVLEQLETARLQSLVEFDRRLGSINSRRQRANRIKSPGTVVRFVVSDLIDLDQGSTTSSVRADAQAVTLRERTDPQDATIRSLEFTSTAGSIESLDSKSQLFRVTTSAAVIPTGVFDIELVDPVQLTLLVFDIAATPSQPKIEVEISANGISFTPALNTALNGYRVNAWITPSKVRFIRVSITPTHPDNLGGDSFTFGLTSFAGDGLDFHLRSELLFDPIQWSPGASRVRFRAEDIEGVHYFLAVTALSGVPQFLEIKPDDELLLPGAADVSPVSVPLVGVDWTVQAESIAGSPVELGTIIKPTIPNGFSYEVTTSGTVDTAEPTWPTTIGVTVTSGTVVFTCHADQAGTPWSVVASSLDSTALGLGATVRPTLPNGFVYEVTVAGMTSTEPVWPLTLGNTTTSGGVTFITRLEGRLGHTLPTDTYLNTITVTEDGTGEQVRVAPALSFLDTSISKLVNKYIGVLGQQLNLIRDDVASDIGRTFTISYSTGPAQILAQLRVVLSTEDRSITPVFRGASLEEV